MKKSALFGLMGLLSAGILYHGSGFIIYYHDRFHYEMTDIRIEEIEGLPEKQKGAAYRVYKPSRPLKRAWLDQHNSLSLQWDALDMLYCVHFKLCVFFWGHEHTERIWN